MRVYQFRHIRGPPQSSPGSFARAYTPYVPFGALSRRLVLLAAALAGLVAAAGASARTFSEPARMVELVVTLHAPPLAEASLADRQLASVTRTDARLDLRAPASVSYLRTLASAQRALAARVTRTLPGSFVRWHYSVVANGIAVVVPAEEQSRLAGIPGVAKVYASLPYHALLDRSPAQIGAPTLWGPGLSTAGNGMKIGIVDDGVDQAHPFFNPARFSMPAGFPKGQKGYTTAKVIAARSFAPPYRSDPGQGKPFDPQGSFHATHVAGIAAGDNGTPANGIPGTPTLSGIAPNAVQPSTGGIGFNPIFANWLYISSYRTFNAAISSNFVFEPKATPSIARA